MIKYNILKAGSASQPDKEAVAEFLFNHLDEFRDEKKDIMKAINYAVGENSSPGGFVIQATENDETIGAVVINHTGMGGYIPENILVYIAIHNNQRGKGLGKELMKRAIKEAVGDIALHVEPHNPAKFLYEKLGFTNKYLEMRLKKE